MKTIIGIVKLLRGERSACVCCDGKHIFSRQFILEPYESPVSKHLSVSLDDWVRNSFDLSELEGRKIEITAAVVEEPTDERELQQNNEIVREKQYEWSQIR